MQTLHEIFFQSSRFLIGTVLVSVRGSMVERNAIKARTFANELVACPPLKWGAHAQHAASLEKAHEMGVQIIAGSDAGSYGLAHAIGFFANRN